MKTSLYLAWLAVVGFGVVIWRQEREIAGVVRAARGPAEAPGRISATAATRPAAEAKPGANPAAVMPTPAADARRIEEISAWLGSLRLLQRALTDHPEWNVPETALLREEDWLGLAHTFRALDSPETLRVALAELRTAAKVRYAAGVSRALKAYADANAGALPSALADLKSFLDPKYDGTWLDRYELVRTGLMKDTPPGGSIIMEKNPVDPEFDQKIGVPARGGSPTYNRWKTADFSGAVATAASAYLHDGPATAKPGAGGTDAVAAYMTSPTAAAIAGSVVAYRREHGGLDPVRPAELLPYITDPAGRAEIERQDAVKANQPH